MFFQNSIKAVTAVAFMLIACFVVGCGSGKPAPVVSPSDQDSVFKIVSTTFSSGIVDNSTSTDVGSYCSIAIDPDDNYPAVAYYDNYSSNQNLMYAKWDGSDWDDKTVVDSDGNVGEFCSLAFDSSGNPSIGYYDRDNEALKWAYDDDDDGDWDEGDWPMTLADNANEDFGQYCSHDISGNSFGFAFYEAIGADLLYLEYNIVTSYVAQVDIDTSDEVGEYCSLKFHSGVAGISYYDATNGELKYATEDSPYWDVQEVEDNSADNVGSYSSLVYDGSGNPSIAYYNDTDEDAMWARWNPLRGVWACVTLVNDGGENWGQHISHKWFGSSKCGFAFEASDGTSSWLEFVRWAPGAQDEYVADATTDCGDFSSFAWVASGVNRGDAWISHRDFDNDYLRYTFVND
jgi:hypothetical protein